MILDDKENSKTSDIEDVVSLDDTSVASECDVKLAKITLGSKMLLISLSLGDQITTTLATSVLPVCSEENS